jgi:hypothetical protein
MQLIFALAIGLGHLTNVAQALCNAGQPLNTLANCNLGSPVTDGSTLFYDFNDDMDVGAQFVSNGQCSVGSFAPAILVSSRTGARYDCGCLPLTGDFNSALQTIDWYAAVYPILMFVSI